MPTYENKYKNLLDYCIIFLIICLLDVLDILLNSLSKIT